MNPILPRKFFIPDAEAHTMPDGRLYLYGSMDISGSASYCSNEYRVFSTDDPVLERWTDHGVSFRDPGMTLYAPDAIEKDGKYYLYYCGASNFEGVASAEFPTGPFENPRAIPIADGDSIDPAVFADDDGSVYYFWGQFQLKGAKMNADLCTINESTLRHNIVTEEEHGFHEGASVRKRNGIYYLVYTDVSRGKATCLGYATAVHPLGPYTKRGIIIDNINCDPQTWNNHGSIEEYKGNWYVFYHRSSQNGPCCRRVCAEPIYFTEDGLIPEVEMTSQGTTGPVCAYDTIDASIACRLFGGAYIVPVSEGCEVLAHCGRSSWGDGWAEFKYIDFGTGGAAVFHMRASGHGKIITRTRCRAVLAECDVDTDTLTDFTVPVSMAPSGVLPLWLTFSGKDITVDSFCFERGGQ